jgi:chromosome segregation ATPase
MEQLMALGVEPGDQNLATKSLAALKAELVEEKAGREKAQAEVETLARAVVDLKNSVDKFAAQIPVLEEKVKRLDNKVIDTLTDACAKELSLERVTKANEDYKSQNTQLTRKLESNLPFPLSLEACILFKLSFL